MAAGRWDALVEIGATWSRRVTWLDPDGAPVDLSGWGARMQLRESAWSPAVLVELSTDNGRIVLSGPGALDLTLSSTDTQLLSGAASRRSTVVYDLELTRIGTDPPLVIRLLEGGVGLSPEVTRGAP